MKPRKRAETLHEAIAAVRPGLRDMATRIVNGEESFLETLMTLGGISREEAVHALRVYRKNRVLTVHQGEIRVKHGGFLERDAIRRAAEWKLA